MFNRYPYTNFHELNLDYFIQHFKEIFTEWEQLYNELQSWKTDTTEELDQWRADVETDLDEREAALRAELEIWKQDTADDISEWETATLNALDAWKTAATAQFEAIRVQAAASAEAAATSQTAAASAAAAALQSETAAEEAAAAIQASATQIATNTADITDLKTQLNEIADVDGTLTEDAFINYLGGVPYSYSGTNYITANVSGGMVLFYNATIATPDNRGLAFYDENGTYISNSGVQMLSTKQKIDVPTNAKIVKATVETANDIIIVSNNKTIHDIVAEIEENKSDISANNANIENVKTFIGTISPNFTSNTGVRDSTGNEFSNASYSATDYIICASAKIKVKTFVDNDFSGICYYDKNKKYISGFNPYSISGVLTELTPPLNAVYVRISCFSHKVNDFSLIISDALTNTLIETPTIKANAETLIGITEPSKNLLPAINTSKAILGTTVTYNDGEFTIVGTGTGDGGRTSYVLFFTLPAGTYTFTRFGDLVINQTIHLQNGTTILATATPEGATFTLEAETNVNVGFNVTNGTVYNMSGKLQLESGTKKTHFVKPSRTSAIDYIARHELEEQNISGKCYEFSMWKSLHIGDSLTAGILYTSNPQAIDQNYPRLFGRMINGEATNAGVSGYSASDWYTNKAGQYTYSNYDTFIIWLGTNDGLTDTLDTDVNPYTDYNDFADTNTGNYCKIIEKIKDEHGGTCLIVLTKVFASSNGGTVSETNTTIDKIAAKYNLPVVDNSDLAYSQRPELHNNVNDVHFGKAGYCFIANRFATKIGAWMAENPTRCEFSYFNRTN